MPTIDTKKIRNGTVYMDGKPIIEIQEIESPEMSIARGKFIDKLKADKNRNICIHGNV